MKKTLSVWISSASFALLLGMSACEQKEISQGTFQVIPLPQHITMATDNSSFILNEGTPVCYPAQNEKMKRNAQFLASSIEKLTGTHLKLTTGMQSNAICLQLDSLIQNPEGYELHITPEQILIKGSTEAGIFYGIQTLHKALPLTQGKSLAAIPCGTVKDEPRFGYRGFMIDVGRHFFSTDYIKEVIDMLAMHNINYFHWHLTEDQGWRIEIKKYPRLTEIGSKRKETIKTPGGNEYDNTPVSGYYTQEEAKDIVRYAAERYITVIPEIDMPGHMLAALASYPELGCTGGPYEVATRFGVFDDVLCGGKDSTLQFAKDVINEIMDIFPSPYIHIGGDECPKKHWKACPKCQQKIKNLGLKDTPEHSKENQLQAWFMGEVEKEIQKRGRKMMAWDEILDGNPAKSTTVMAWTSPKARIKAATEGHQTIACPITHLYFSNPGYNRLKGISSIARVYEFEPVPEILPREAQADIIGAQGCIWTEWTKDSVKMEWQMMPRIAALAEIQWSRPENKSLDSFLKRLRHQLDIYTAYGYHYKQDIENVTIEVESGENRQAQITLTTFDHAPVYYTTDGSTPSASANRYESPFTVQEGCTIKARAIRGNRESEISEETIRYNLATMRPLSLKEAPDEKYIFKGKSILNDGLVGDGNYHSGRYLGFYGTDVEATIDLQADTEISSAFIKTCLVPGDYIFGLSSMEVYASKDGKKFQKLAGKSIPILEKGSPNNITKSDTITFDKTRTRFVRIVGKSTGKLPQWHSGAGKTAYLFVDEIGVN